MSDQLPPPQFDDQNYARPNQNWTCGHAAEGRSCPLGPNRLGRCQATFECQPVLEIKPGETKGRWRCTRSGGVCELGPRPDGACCRPIAPCSPRPSLRWQRGRFTLAVVAASLAVLLMVLGSPPVRDRFFNPGPVSRAHSGTAFAALAATNHLDANCGACHVAGATGPRGIVHTAFAADPSPVELVKLFSAEPAEVTPLDGHCETCHAGHSFHQATVVTIACTYCHQEHQGSKMAAVGDAGCGFCHGNSQTMATAATAGAKLPPEAFQLGMVRRSRDFPAPHPARGFTEVIHGFADDHPEFRFITDHWRDPDTLKFNHALHLTGATIPALPNGHKLECSSCHQTDAGGKFMAPVKFEQNCRVCHSLQFDPATPGLTLPHGRTEEVTAFLHSLPQQYTDYARRQGVAAGDQAAFVSGKLAQLQRTYGSGEALGQQVFLSTAKTGPPAQIGALRGATRPVFPGCAYCHEVTAAGTGDFAVTPPVIFERWLTHATFDHGKHSGLACEKCHDAIHSRDTADVLLPAREACVECHSPQGGVANTCATCHEYHKPLVARVN